MRLGIDGQDEEETLVLSISQAVPGATMPVAARETVILPPLDLGRGKAEFPPPRFQVGRKRLLFAGGVLCLIALLMVFYIRTLPGHAGPSSQSTLTPGILSHPDFPRGIGAFKAPNGELIGLSDGSYAFDTGPDRSDRDLKTQASMNFLKGDSSVAASLWEEAVAEDSNDAEALIYREDQRVLGSGLPYITFVLGTSFAAPLPNYSNRDILQGAYIAQKDYNDHALLPGQTMVRLLIARSGSEAVYTKTIAQLIVQAAQADKTIVGVLGWATSTRTLDAYPILTQAKIPMVSHSATGDTLTGVSPYYFRIVPPNSVQAQAGAQYASQALHAGKVVAFEDPTDEANVSSVNDFTNQFKAEGHQVVKVEDFTTGKTTNFPQLLNDALRYQPDLLYMPATSPYDTFALLKLLPTKGPFAGLDVLSGDAAYSLVSTPSPITTFPNFDRLRFTSLSDPDIWIRVNHAKQTPPFFSEYAQAYDPHAQYPGRYGYSRTDAYTMLSYDVMQVFLVSSSALLNEHKAVTPRTLQQQLEKITVANPIQGVAGQIAFNSQHDPVNKIIVVLRISSQGYTQIDGVQGCFFSGCAA